MGLINVPQAAASTGFSFKVPAGTTADTLSATNSFAAGSYYVPTLDTSNIVSVTLGTETKTASQAPTTVTIASSASSVSTVPLRKWTLVSNAPYIGSTSMLSFVNGIFIAGNNGGKLATSTDGLTWTTRNSMITSALQDVAYGNGMYMLTGDNGYMRSSTDAITWTSKTTFLGNDMFGIAYGASTFCVGGAGGNIATSTDGVIWTSRNSGFGGSVIRDMIFANNLFVAVGDSGKLSTSPDGSTWTIRTVPNFTTNDIQSIAYGNSTFIVVGQSGAIGASTDGITWTTRTSPISNSLTYFGVAFGNNAFIAGYNNTSSGVNIVASTDGVTWTTRFSNFIGTQKYTQSLAAGNGAYVAGISSNDGSDPTPLSRATTSNVAFGSTESETFVTLIPVTSTTGV